MSGLTTEEALNTLISEIKETLKNYESAWNPTKYWNLFLQTLSSRRESSLFPWTSVCMTSLNAFALMVLGLRMSCSWLIAESLLLLGFIVINVALSLGDLYLKEVEMTRRLENVVKNIENHLANGLEWSPENYPHLHTPLSASVVLQWTIRDGKKINLPWSLLAKNDLIYLKPGQVAPGKCHNEEITMNKGEILHLLPDDHTGDNVSPMPEFKPPVEPQLFILEETPYMSTVNAVLDRIKLDRPTSRLTKYQHLFFIQLLTQSLAPLFLILSLIWSVFKVYHQQMQDDSTVIDLEMLLLRPSCCILPLVSLSFPLYWTAANYVALAKVLNDFLSFRHVHVTDDPFDDTPDNQQPNLILEKATKESNVSSLKTAFVSALLGDGEHLSRSESNTYFIPFLSTRGFFSLYFFLFHFRSHPHFRVHHVRL